MAIIYKVGGYVRDKLLGIESNDIDFTYVSSNLNQTVEEGYAEMRNYLIEGGFSIFLETPEYVTIRSMFPKGHKEEGTVADFVLARKELSYAGDSRKPTFVMGNLYDDLSRRDFTVNALAEDPEGGIIDYFNGTIDIQRKVLRTPLETSKTMMDDPLRYIRALRFSITKGFYIHMDIRKIANSAEFLDKLELTVHSQRIRQELEKMFKHDSLQSMHLISYVCNMCDKRSRLGNILFKDGLWLLPTFKDR